MVVVSNINIVNLSKTGYGPAREILVLISEFGNTSSRQLSDVSSKSFNFVLSLSSLLIDVHLALLYLGL